MIEKIKNFFEKEIWHKNISELPKIQSLFFNFLRVVVMSFKGFVEDRVQLRSSALTYYSLLSIVPVLALAFGISKGFGMEEKLNQLLIEKLSSHEDIMNQVVNFANSLLENTKGGLVAGIGVVLLFWSVLKVLGNIEESFNAIWGISKGRSIISKFTEYLTIMLIAPILLIMSSSFTVFLSSMAKETIHTFKFLSFLDSELSFLLSLFPYIIFWFLLTMVYMIMPNTKVRFKSAFIAGIVSGSLFVIVQWAYVRFQIGVVQFNAIYGSFAALPLFLVWLRTSWTIVLFGAELSFVHQNVENYVLKEESSKLSFSYQKKLSIYVVHYIIKRFSLGEAPTLEEIKKELNLPFKLTSQITEDLVSSKILSKIENEDYKTLMFQPAIDTSKLTVKYLIDSLDRLGFDDIPKPTSKTYQTISEKVDSLLQEKTTSLIKDI